MASLKWPKFEGLNTRDRIEELKPGELSVARNVDITAEGRLTRRDGFDDIASLTGDYHSLWAKDGLICLAVKAGNLLRINDDWSEAILRVGVGDNAVSYVEVNSTVYYTNGTVIGYVTAGTDYLFTDPGVLYKRAPFPGQLIEYFNGRLYIAKDYVLWFTDALAFNRIDMRKGFKMLPGTITMLKAVDGGIYLSDSDATYWMAGTGPNVATIKKVEGPAKPGSALVINGQKIKSEFQGSYLLFTTDNGICLGTSEGQVVNVTQKKYRLPDVKRAAAMVRDEDNKLQYVARLYN
jgi:hypothetical protein